MNLGWCYDLIGSKNKFAWNMLVKEDVYMWAVTKVCFLGVYGA